MRWRRPAILATLFASALTARATIAGALPAEIEAPLPLHFEPNVGRAPGAEYLARGAGFRVALTAHGVLIGLHGSRNDDHKRSAPIQTSLQLRLLHSRADAAPQPANRLAAVSNYFIGKDPAQWHRNVPNYGSARYQSVYPGVDWVLYGDGRDLEYDFIVAPHADPRAIQVAIERVDGLSLDRNGDLLIDLDHHTMRQRKPVVYQSAISGERRFIPAHYVIHHHRISFALGAYDQNQPLIIDPALAYSTFLGGTGGAYGYAIAVDGAGSAYVVGETDSTDFPTLGAFQTQNRTDNAFIAKFSPSGRKLIYSTYLGGSAGENARAIAVDGAGNAYVAGYTFSSDFPTVNAVQSTNRAGMTNVSKGYVASQAFVAKLNATGDALVYSTYLGGSGSGNGGSLDAAYGLALDATGSAYVAGITDSSDFPLANALQGMLRGRGNAFVTKLSSSGGALIYSTYLGGSAFDQALGLTLDGADNAYVAGFTNSSDFPLVAPIQNVNRAGSHGTAFISKLSAAGTTLIYSTYLGGSGFEQASSITVDSSGNAYVVGATASTDFPTVNALQSTNNVDTANGKFTGFISKIDAIGTSLVFSTYLGGSGADEPLAIAVNSSREVFVAGETYSSDFPTLDPVQSENKAVALMARNAFVTQLTADGAALVFSTYLGGSGSFGPTEVHTTIPFDDYATGIALDKANNIYISGITGSVDFPTINAYQPINKSATMYGADPTAFVAKFGTEASDPTATPTPPSSGPGGGGGLDWNSISILLTVLAARCCSARQGRVP